jgi:hypothetical protein
MASGPTQSPIELDVKCATDCRASERHEVIVMACLARAVEVGRSGDPAAFGTRKRKSSGFAAGAFG